MLEKYQEEGVEDQEAMTVRKASKYRSSYPVIEDDRTTQYSVQASALTPCQYSNAAGSISNMGKSGTS